MITTTAHARRMFHEMTTLLVDWTMLSTAKEIVIARVAECSEVDNGIISFKTTSKSLRSASMKVYPG